MAEYKVTIEEQGSPILGFVYFIVGIAIIGLIVSFCANKCDGASSYEDANQAEASVSEITDEDGSVIEVMPDVCGIEELYVLGETGFPEFFDDGVTNAYGTEYAGNCLSLWGANIPNPNGEGYVSGIELVADHNYQYFSGTYFASAAQRDDQTIELFIYADDELVYSSGVIDRRTDPIEFTVDIKNCKVLRIETLTPNYYHAIGSPSRIYIVNGTVSK